RPGLTSVSQRKMSLVTSAAIRGLASRPEQRDDGPPFFRVVAGSLGCRIRAGSAPKLRIESGLGRAEFHVPVSPKGIDAVWILATRMGHGAPGVNQVGHDRPFCAQLRMFSGQLHPIQLRFAFRFGWN